MKDIEREIESRFVCAKCHSTGAEVKSLAMSGTGLSRLLDLQHNRYVFASCSNCGFTEVYNLDILAYKTDDAMNILDIIFG
jgi:predicted nucleic-acid-binding Zn-ribbon protein